MAFFRRFRNRTVKFGFQSALPLFAALTALAPTLPQAAVGDWTSYTHVNRVFSLQAYGGWMFAGTQGGIRRIGADGSQAGIYDNRSGLVDTWTVGFGVTESNELWAVSKDGYVSRWIGTAWEAFGRGYASEGWKMNDRAVLASGPYLYLGSEKGLSVFDTRKKVAEANLTRFGDEINLSVLSLLRKDDTLFIGTPRGILQAEVDFSNPFASSTARPSLFDPNAWKIKVAAEPEPDTSETDEEDSLPLPTNETAFSQLVWEKGELRAYPPGTVLLDPVRIEMLPGRAFRIGRLDLGAAAAGYETAALLGKTLFVGGASLYRIPDPTVRWVDLQELSNPSSLPQDTLANIAVTALGPVALSVWGIYGLEDGRFKRWADLPSHSPEIQLRHLKTLVPGTDRDFWVGSWGSGLLHYANGKIESFDQKQLPCIENVLPDYAVVQALSDPLDRNLWMSLNIGEEGRKHQLVHFDTETKTAACVPENQETGTHIRGIKLLSEDLLVTAGDEGIALYRVLGGDRDRVSLIQTLGAGEPAWDAALDRFGKVWVLAGGQLKFIDSVLFDNKLPERFGQLQFVTAPGFPGRECRNLEADARNKLWAGCRNGLYEITPGPSGTQTVVRHSPENGVIGWNILDLAVDKQSGAVWVTTDRGVSRYESASLPPLKTLKTVRAYPNPFRARHSHLVLDPVPVDATVRILSESGTVVRTLRPSENVGNQAHWDGRDQRGEKVRAGIYFFSVENGGKTERGKVVVAR